MSTSPESLLRKTPIAITAADPMTEIFLLDGQFQRIERGLGTLNTAQPPGIYQVKLRSGFQTSEDMIAVRDLPVMKSYPPIPVVLTMPLENSAKTHEFHIDSAERMSLTPHVIVGQGSSIFVFARDWTAPNPPADSRLYPNPARGLKLLDAGGAAIVDIEGHAEANLQWDPYAGCRVELAPGNYLLQCTTPDGRTACRSVIACAGFQTQIFLLQCDYQTDGGSLEKGPDILNAVVSMSHNGYIARDPQLHIQEMARLGVKGNRPVLSAELMRMLRAKFDYPMCGIYGAHLLLAETDFDRSLLEEVVRNLRGLLGSAHPDVEAIALAIDQPVHGSFTQPPMLRKSWDWICRASAKDEAIVPAGSISAVMATRRLASDLWVVWEPAPAPDDQSEVLEEMVADALHRYEKPGSIELPHGALSFAARPSGDIETQMALQFGLPRAVIDQLLPKARARAASPMISRQNEAQAES